MAATTPKVELELYATSITNSTLFILDDPIEGQLDNPNNVLSGFVFVDVTAYVQSVDIQRGKSRLLDRYEAATASISFNNSTRVFDPKYTLSPYYGAIYPRLNVRISVNGVMQFVGVIQDWNLEYDPAGPSFAIANCLDRFTNLTQAILPPDFQTLQLSGSRVNTILDLPEVNWPLDERTIAVGQSILQEDLIPENTDALSYLQLVETSEQGHLFIGKDGKLVFQDRTHFSDSALSFTDAGVGIPYSEINVVYGTELLYNSVEINPLGDITTIVSDVESQVVFGISTLNLVDVLNDSLTEVEEMANYLLNIYKEPEYRFETISIALHKLSLANQTAVLNLELNQTVFVKFTPSKLPPAIEQFCSIIKIEQEITVSEHFVTLSLGSTGLNTFIFDNATFGVLDVGTLLY